ncbi:acyltransferase family protein [Microbacterium sp. zg.Y909]|uniref:acyltransferase family protein n=1 Tax=Microbacterium sp. zg.Y909 TaxID=2969413 RepID=UPI00214ADEC3|nr:acyltransferase family protein [Microbacterium sp. zg.Y909]
MGAASPPHSASPGFRADIQGLRAVAVVIVVVDHAFHWPAGGFLGVDVFYVISGFLITGLLLRELETTGSISLRGFYARRMRRIVPAAVTVLAVTVAAAFALWFLPRAVQTLLDALSALLFVSNWHFIALGTDYLQSTGLVSPLQHYWSLSVEEQFYAVWPLGMLALFGVFRGSRRALIAAIVVGIAVSAAWAAYRTLTNPIDAYFDSLARGWELLAGALIAVAGTAPAGMKPRARTVASISGLALIVAGAVFVSADAPLPFPAVLPAVLGAALVIWAAAPSGRRSVLGNPVAQWLGDVSYSLYLWHFPVLIFAWSIWGEAPVVAVLCVPVMLLLSELTRRYVEKPALRSRFLSGWARARNVRPFQVRDVAVGIAVFATIAVLSVGALRGPAMTTTAGALADGLRIAHLSSDAGAVDTAARRMAIEDALSAAEWPDGIRAQLDVLYPSQQTVAMQQHDPGCLNDVFERSATRVCRGASELMLVGDSVALSWLPTVEAAYGERATAVGFANCPLIDVSVADRRNTPGHRDACDARRDEMLDLVAAGHPEVVFTSSSEGALGNTGLPLAEAAEAWEAGARRTFERLRSVPSVLVLSNPPLTADPAGCATRMTSPEECTSAVSDVYAAKLAAEVRAAADYPNVTVVDTQEWFCAQDRCPVFVDGFVVRTDGIHLTDAAAIEVAGLLPTNGQTDPEAMPAGG